jgi:hypothetical protein
MTERCAISAATEDEMMARTRLTACLADTATAPPIRPAGICGCRYRRIEYGTGSYDSAHHPLVYPPPEDRRSLLRGPRGLVRLR